MPLTLAIDARTATGAFTGIGRYTTSLVRALVQQAPDLSLFLIVTEAARASFAELEGPRVELYATALDTTRHPAADLWLHFYLPRLLARRRIPVLLSCANYLPLFSGGARRIVTIHDLVPYRHPELDPWRFVVYLRAMLRQAAACADRVVSVSEATARELVGILGVPRDRIAVIHNGVSPSFRPLPPSEVRLPAGVPDAPYLLGVGARIPRKNFARLVEAHGELVRRGLPHHLVIAGPPGQSQPDIDAAIARAGTRERVHVIGYPSDDDLLHLYNRAALFVYPSVYEGFGIPVLEAMACGTAVACSNTSSLPEVAGDDAELFDPLSPPAIAAACERVLTDAARAARFRAAGPAHAAHFSWEEAARRTAALVRELA